MKTLTFTQIDDSNKDQIQIYHQLRDKVISSDNSFIADSPKVVNILLQTDIEIKSILATKEYYEEFSPLLTSKNIPKLFVLTKDEMQEIVGHKIHHNCMMHGVRPNNKKLEDLGNNIIMLDEITSTENVGSIARSAAAIGVDAYLVPTKAPHPYSRRSLRVSMGHVSKLDISLYEDISKTITLLKTFGYKIYAAELTNKSVSLQNIKVANKWVILMGHEGKGLSKEVLDLCDEIVKIDMMDGVRSLNVAVATSIIIYQFKNSKN